MKVIEPGSFQREVQLLPGSKERQDIQVESLEKLKQELKEANRAADRKTRMINRGIVISSILAILFLLLNGDKNKASKTKKVLKKLGYALSILAFIKGVTGSSSNLEVIEPHSTSLNERNYSNSIKDKLRILSVRAVMDVLIDMEMMNRNTLKNRSTALRFRSTKGSNKLIINEIDNYGRKL